MQALSSRLGQRIAAGLLAATIVGGTVTAVSAQTTPTATSTSTTTPAASTQPDGSTTNPTTPPQGRPGPVGPRGGFDGGPGGPGGQGGPGGPRGGLSADRLQQALTTAQSDRDAANGKMDLTNVNALLSTAANLINQASPNLSSSDSATAQTAREQAAAAQQAIAAAEADMQATLGTALPSQANQPGRPTPPAGATAPNQQVRSSRTAARAYQAVADATALSKANAGVDTQGLVSQAQALYSQAYTAYQAGQYDKADGLADAASHAADAATQLLRASGATDQPVTVPAPTFS